MEKQIISFSANEQILKKTAGKDRFADDVVGYIIRLHGRQQVFLLRAIAKRPERGRAPVFLHV